MFNYDDTLILFGRSPYINKISKYIPDLCKKYHTMGCNYFCNSYPQVEYVIFYDDLVPTVRPEHKIITNTKYFSSIGYKSYELLHSHKNKSLYSINKNYYEFSENPRILNFCIHTPSMALNWAWLNGFKNVIIAGIDLTLENNEHFDKDTTPDRNGHDFTMSAISRARNHIENVASKHLNVYQLNPESTINIHKIKISELL